MEKAYPPLDEDQLRAWIGRSEARDDVVTAVPLAAWAATLDRDEAAPQAGEPIPPLAHWLYFLPVHRQSAIGPDGHVKRGEFLPPVPLPRRMWAGSRLEFPGEVRVGDSIRRTSRITDIQLKEGRSGKLAFVTVRHEVATSRGLAIVDEHDIVYRGEGKAVADPVPAPADFTWRREIRPDPVLLFRYSALTLNGHRIHYDHPYVTAVEGYPGLVVHGPLIATLLVDLLRREMPGVRLASFRFRAFRPLFDTAPFETLGRRDGERSARLWARDPQGALAMEAQAAW